MSKNSSDQTIINVKNTSVFFPGVGGISTERQAPRKVNGGGVWVNGGVVADPEEGLGAWRATDANGTKMCCFYSYY